MTCPDCTAAATNPAWGGYHAKCQGCQVRALASGMAFFAAKTERRITPAYRAALHALLAWAGLHDARRLDIVALREVSLGRLADAVATHLDTRALLGLLRIA